MVLDTAKTFLVDFARALKNGFNAFAYEGDTIRSEFNTALEWLSFCIAVAVLCSLLGSIFKKIRGKKL